MYSFRSSYVCLNIRYVTIFKRHWNCSIYLILSKFPAAPISRVLSAFSAGPVVSFLLGFGFAGRLLVTDVRVLPYPARKDNLCMIYLLRSVKGFGELPDSGGLTNL